MSSTRSQLFRIFAILAGVLVLGAGVAVAETALNDSDAEVVEADDVEHGRIVSAAAQDHSNDERCGNHGQWVSSVARGLDDCVAEDEAEDAESDVEDEADLDEEVDAEVDETDETDESSGPPEGTHGAIVSAAAQDHSNDERCGNHGRWVSSVARGLDDCVADDAESDDDDSDDAEVESDSVTPGSGRPDHAGPPAGRGNSGR